MIKNRTEAGKLLAEKLDVGKNATVLAIPRGGVVVGYEIAKKLRCPLDIAIAKKITPPGQHSEYAIGAITHDGTTHQTRYWNVFANESGFKEELKEKKDEVERRVREYRGDSDYQLEGKTIVLADDGMATGSTAFAILNWLSKLNVKKIILAIPVMPPETYEMMKKLVSEIVTIEIPSDFSAVGQFYEEFEQVSDEEVLNILKG